MAFAEHDLCLACELPVTCDDVIRNTRCVIAEGTYIYCPFCYLHHLAPASENLDDLLFNFEAASRCKNCNNRTMGWWRDKIEGYRHSLALPTFQIFSLNNPIGSYEFQVDFPHLPGGPRQESETFRGTPHSALPPNTLACRCNCCGR